MRCVQWSSILLCLVIIFGCKAPTAGPTDTIPPWLPRAERPILRDDLDQASLRQALQRSLEYVRRLPQDRSLPCGDRQISAAALHQTLTAFEQLLGQTLPAAALNAALYDQFDIVQAAGQDGQGTVLFTGYHEMLLDGSRVPAPAYPYPLYRRPPDLVEIDPGISQTRYAGERRVGRYVEGKALPYFTRYEIDTDGKLQGHGLELAWLRDAVEGFFLHVQGSGQIRFADGQIMRVNYAASNGHPYRSIGRVLLDAGQLAPADLSLQGIRRYLQAHPDDRSRILGANPRYVFFRQVNDGPRGSLNLILVPGRSVATDARLFPPGGLAFIQTQQPRLNAQGEITGWQPLSRFVLNHDTGGAITGPGRVDLFWGSDAAAEMAAGHMQHTGKLFFLLLRHRPSQHAGVMPPQPRRQSTHAQAPGRIHGTLTQ
jgi:membrane-bound lytic murein transglycosylase A